MSDWHWAVVSNDTKGNISIIYCGDSYDMANGFFHQNKRCPDKEIRLLEVLTLETNLDFS